MQTLDFNECQAVSAAGLGIDTSHSVDYAIAGSILGGTAGLIVGATTASNHFIGATVGLFTGAAVGAVVLTGANLLIDSTKYQEALHVEI